MEQKNYLKLVWILAFVAFAAVSCWATSESLHLLLSSWPIIICWIVTIGFFIIASMGTKMIVDSLNQNIYLEKRGLRLVGGIFILLIFWLICSMPTNTHTFFYRNIINDEVTTDLSTTRGYLGQIKNNTNNIAQAQLKVTELENNVNVLLGELEAEIMNEANPGFGDKSKEILRKVAALLEVDKIEPLTKKGNSKQDRVKLCDAYRQKVYMLAQNRANHIMVNVLSPNPDIMKEVKRVDANLSEIQKCIGNKTLDLNKSEDILEICNKLTESYNVIKKNRDFVNFSSKKDEEVYTADSPLTRVKRMISVIDVWKDFIAGKYAGRGFIFWVVISVLVDVAAFIFFDLAFRKKDF